DDDGQRQGGRVVIKHSDKVVSGALDEQQPHEECKDTAAHYREPGGRCGGTGAGNPCPRLTPHLSASGSQTWLEKAMTPPKPRPNAKKTWVAASLHTWGSSILSSCGGEDQRHTDNGFPPHPFPHGRVGKLGLRELGHPPHPSELRFPHVQNTDNGSIDFRGWL
ncbi:unnamed protein product, partial [Gulo gulo]